MYLKVYMALQPKGQYHLHCGENIKLQRTATVLAVFGNTHSDSVVTLF
jgi:hypothetical protein